ncbi:MAG: peptidylprolyl isomerase [Candidatus Pacebacteria bacterium]|nr:peptidylprolyl isomerase [Candidatus Paceibacterota bacterium]
MTTATEGSKVRVHYTGSLDDGTVFDTSRNRQPLEFTLGESEIIAGFEDAVKGMEEGEEKQVKITPEQGYGHRNEQAVMDIPEDELPDDIEPQVGMVLQGQTKDGGAVRLRITEVKDDGVKVDGNHPLAGQNLTFDVELVEVVE